MSNELKFLANMVLQLDYELQAADQWVRDFNNGLDVRGEIEERLQRVTTLRAKKRYYAKRLRNFATA